MGLDSPLIDPVCIATNLIGSVPEGVSLTWNTTTLEYDYSCSWSVTFTCDSGMTSACSICVATLGWVSSDNGNTWQSLGTTSAQSSNGKCGKQYLAGFVTTYAGLVSGNLYLFQFGALPAASDNTCDNWTQILGQQQFDCPAPP